MSETPVDEPAAHRENSVVDVSAQPDALWSRLRRLLMRLRCYAGVFVGPFILIAACSGRRARLA